jgi:hypothetical protein
MMKKQYKNIRAPTQSKNKALKSKVLTHAKNKSVSSLQKIKALKY